MSTQRAILAAVLCVSWFSLAASQDPLDMACVSEWPTHSLCKYVTPLTIPNTIDTSDGKLLDIGSYKIKQQMHRDLNATTLYAYGTSKDTASSPGPTLIAQKNKKTVIRWTNHIDDASMCASKEICLPVDETLDIAQPKEGVANVVHVHGAMVSSFYDGHPEAWHTSAKFGYVGMEFVNNTHEYPNEQDATGLWYHDHTMGITRLTVFAGLAGMYIIRDTDGAEKHFADLLQGTPEVPLVLDDKLFHPDGALNYPGIGDNPGEHPEWMPEFFGSHILVNGKVWPYMNVEPRMYRFRVLDAANARFFTLKFWVLDSVTRKPLRQLPFSIIGSDQGYLNKPVTLKSYRMGPGERAHMLVDFSSLPMNATVVMQNHAPAPFPSGDAADLNTGKVMKFVVNMARSADAAPIKMPARFNRIPAVNTSRSVNSGLGRIITLTERESLTNGNPLHSYMEGRTWAAPTTIWPRTGTMEKWTIINFTVDMHPIHIHLVPHRVLSRQKFNHHAFGKKRCSFEDGSCLVGKAYGPHASEAGWKDTTQCSPGHVTTMLLDFRGTDGRNFSFDATKGPGYVIHCHILAHEDNEMMRPFEMLPAM